MFLKLNSFKYFSMFVSLNFLSPVVLDAAIAYLNDWLLSFLLFSGLTVQFKGIHQLGVLVFVIDAVVFVFGLFSSNFFNSSIVVIINSLSLFFIACFKIIRKSFS